MKWWNFENRFSTLIPRERAAFSTVAGMLDNFWAEPLTPTMRMWALHPAVSSELVGSPVLLKTASGIPTLSGPFEAHS